MLQKISAGYSAPISKFKNNPAAYVAEANGDAVAVMSHNEIGFYAVPAALFEDLLAFAEYAQRGTSELKNIPSKFNGEGLDMDKIAGDMATKLLTGTAGDYEEWP
ncbi:MAG TPA: hypothetical protein PLM85_08970 [Nitrosomonas sp.]|nr:hypothetical protein [Nitrosomonas sp.]